MTESPVLLFLHGVGKGDWEATWKESLSRSLIAVGYPGLDEVRVIAPKYANALRGVDDNPALPEVTINVPWGDAAKQVRRDFERRMGALEGTLGRSERGGGWGEFEVVVDLGLLRPSMKQARNYLSTPRVRAVTLERILSQLPRSGRLVIVGHSLGSVLAADLLCRLPRELEVVGLVSIGSPIGHSAFNVDPLRKLLKEPPVNLGWWMNFWSAKDPVTAHAGVSAVFPWMVDRRVRPETLIDVHGSAAYLAVEEVAIAIGYGLFGSRSKELVAAERGVDIPLDATETRTLLALRYAHLVKGKLDGELQDRFADALFQVQAEAVRQIREGNAHRGRPMPSLIAELSVDIGDVNAATPVPGGHHFAWKDQAVDLLTSMATTNVIQPYEIQVPDQIQREAFEDLAVEMGLGRQFGIDVFESVVDARKTLAGNDGNWIKWTALAVGTLGVMATGGLAIAAAPAGLAGAAAITSALAAFGPGGMVGGLLTAGALVSMSSGGLAAGLASSATSAETVEVVVASRLAAALLRKRQGLAQDPATWINLVQTAMELRHARTHLEVISDESAPGLKELKRKEESIHRASLRLKEQGLVPDTIGDAGGGSRAEAEPHEAGFFSRVADPFRPVDLDDDGIPDKPRALTALEGAGASVKDAASSLGERFRRRRESDGDPSDELT